jgi:hypothetical protein
VTKAEVEPNKILLNDVIKASEAFLLTGNPRM